MGRRKNGMPRSTPMIFSKVCTKCGGSGDVESPKGHDYRKVFCPECDGKGFKDDPLS